MTIAAPLAHMQERELQKHVRAMLSQFGWRTAVTWTSLHSPKGWPDLFACRKCAGIGCGTEAVAIELKREKGKVTPEQAEWLAMLGELPGVKFAGVIRPSDWFAGALDAVLR